jgi:hypothetical protein
MAFAQKTRMRCTEFSLFFNAERRHDQECRAQARSSGFRMQGTDSMCRLLAVLRDLLCLGLHGRFGLKANTRDRQV